ncbi:MAG TPA: DUF4097 family beta strand repeat-containing protein [Acidimicrobiales bacterium]|jgi:hypothetical protein|nr:DUF4097 family beta strand repeat-containing protein [Acidimicrobiales bacterium]
MTTPRSTGQRVAIGLALVVTLALIAGGAVQAAAALVIQSKDTTHTFTGSFTSLSVNVDGDVTVQAGPAGQITEATHQVWSFVRPTITETLHGDELTIKATCSGLSIGDCGTSVKLTVPAASAVDVDSSDSNVRVDGISGALNLHSSDGDVSLSNDSGPLQLSSNDGNVQGADLSSSAVTASSMNGDVNLQFASPPRAVTGTSRNGNVDVGLPRGPARYLVSASSDNGNRSVDVHSDAAADRRITVGSDNGDVSVKYAGS